jgi:hypothetical protein
MIVGSRKLLLTREAKRIAQSDSNTRDVRMWRWTPAGRKPLLDRGAFLNTWKIDADYFVLTFISGYERQSVDLQKLDSAKGLVPIFGFGG